MSEELTKRTALTLKSFKDEVESLMLPPSEIQPSSDQPILVISLFKRCNRSYILKVVHQINRTYEDTCYDACSVMIRRLVETLIIEVYESRGIADKIKEPNGKDFKTLKFLIEDISKESTLNITRNCRNGLDAMKAVGDLSAHSRKYNAHREDIDGIRSNLRVAVQELLSLAGMY